MILGIGVDVCHVPRIARLATNPRFPARILSLGEHERFNLLNGPVERTRFLAVRWAIKESAYKALYPTYQPTWKDLAFLTHQPENKKPILTFSKNKEIKLHASVSHDGEYVFATVFAERV
ncbi:Holo-[acyl-carrier-protein] synthase OS=Bacillus amyloliquefaciens (strain FZB42) GN=acpS PE=3 SV=1 [Rhizoctonia solani AG-1 IB]|uniref:Holo-[acyl-carrier-protein] synthase n=1 Tax=Thanatephorus cucumeris (strain AG1-IB / isolate 7/3/14) TaxID=1108050 RepID=A0A0B7FHI2_THACB|nr:Holo-[acyl-carrier-protein] synthase OS=Bacillus amyloliquefaciens (strain FZB42) GN=acpS PE=3 SV=1 [Rhizoctonia solani AG-1 IB]